MSVRKLLVAVAVVGLGVSVPAPAGADEGLGVATFAGEVVAMTGSVTSVRTIEIVGRCAYTGVTTLNGKVQFTFGGETVSYSTIPTSAQPVATQAACTLVSPQQASVPNSPATLSQTTSIASSGAAAVTAPALTAAWPLRPVKICVAGSTLYSPAPATRTLNQACSAEALAPVVGAPACSDGMDNDADGKTDYADDGGCTGPLDMFEQDGPCNPILPGVVACMESGQEFASYTVATPADLETAPGPRVAGYVDAYRFTFGGTSVTVPCVTLLVEESSASACSALGGTFVRRDATLADATVGQPTVVPGEEIATVRVCHATLTATALGFGASSGSALTIC